MTSANARLQRWAEYFAEQEHGALLQPGKYGRAVLQARRARSLTWQEPAVEDLPTLADVEEGILALSCGKASGLDNVTAEVLRADVAQTAKLFFPVYLKAALACREPVAWKGGALVTLAKRAGHTLQCSAYRLTAPSC